MKSRDFCYWLQGFFELNQGSAALTLEQSRMVKNHLALVLKHEIDPAMGDANHQQELTNIHGDKVTLGGINPAHLIARC